MEIKKKERWTTGSFISFIGMGLFCIGAASSHVAGTHTTIQLSVGSALCQGFVDFRGNHISPDFDFSVIRVERVPRANPTRSSLAVLETLATPNHQAILYFSDSKKTKPVRVNHPVTHRKWLFYLVSYDPDAPDQVVMRIRRDPGRIPFITGAWSMMLGISLHCFRKRKICGNS